jgi:Ca2+-binding RTX toxin-like protein
LWGFDPDPNAEIETTRDYLNGASGQDTIIAGAGDVVSTGADADLVLLGDWIAEGEPAAIMDFDQAQDELAVLWDFETNADPWIELLDDQDQAGTKLLLVDGVTYARIHGGDGLSVEDILVIDAPDPAQAVSHTA